MSEKVLNAAVGFEEGTERRSSHSHGVKGLLFEGRRLTPEPVQLDTYIVIWW